MGWAASARLMILGRYQTAHTPVGWLILMEMVFLTLLLAMMPQTGNYFILMTGKGILISVLNSDFLDGRPGIYLSLISTRMVCQISFWRTEAIYRSRQIISV